MVDKLKKLKDNLISLHYETNKDIVEIRLDSIKKDFVEIQKIVNNNKK
tara:strand:- start:74 stop:217 length:144 start_codon:yes stop_codon:yes gene_type:complete